MTTVAFYDTKPYDRQYMLAAAGNGRLHFEFHEFRCSQKTAASAAGATSVCGFVNDRFDRPCLDVLREGGVRHLALRCAGFNNVDLPAAAELGMAMSSMENVWNLTTSAPAATAASMRSKALARSPS
jgi:D-lactate dehydrogenase